MPDQADDHPYVPEPNSGQSYSDWEKFIDLPCWRELVLEMQQATDSLQRDLLQPMRDMNDALVRNYTNGRIIGMMAMSLSIVTKMELLQRELQRKQQEVEDGRDSSTGTEPTG